MGLAKIALNFMVERGGKLAKSLLCTKPPKMPINIKGLKYTPIKTDSFQHIISPEIEKLVNKGFTIQEAQEALKHVPRDTLEEVNKGAILNFIEQQKQLWGRTLNIHGKNNFSDYEKFLPTELGEEIMELTRKMRAKDWHKKGLIPRIPECFKITAEEENQIVELRKAFSKLPKTDHDIIQYRGEYLDKDMPGVKFLIKAKEGEKIKLPGYTWTTDSPGYAFGRYAAPGHMKENKIAIKYTILYPEGSQLSLSRSRLGQEFLVDEKEYKIVKKVLNDAGDEMLVFLEHIVR